MKALIDLDILCYELGGTFELSDGTVIDDPTRPEVLERVNQKIEYILRKVGAGSWQGFITDSKSNFRIKVATILPYKGNRESEKPIFYRVIREYLLSKPNVELVEGMEADDALGIYQYSAFSSGGVDETIICSRDKDLRMIPGWHFGWKMGNQSEFPVTYISDETGHKNFYSQMLTGDSSDNILGLYGVGKKSSLVKKVQAATSVSEMDTIVWNAYKDRFGGHASTFFDENCRLLWIKRQEGNEV